jgi:hypothetical protein
MRVFYSFSLRLDGPTVNPLAAALADLGYEPTIPIGRHIRVHNWRSRLAEVLRKSDAAVVIVSPENESNPYVMGELWAARVLSQINRRFVLVPVLRGTSGVPEYVTDLYAHEIGLFQGRLGFEKVVVVRHQDCESFSNISGINEIQYESDGFQTVFEKLRHIAVREGLLSKARG